MNIKYFHFDICAEYVFTQGKLPMSSNEVNVIKKSIFTRKFVVRKHKLVMRKERAQE